MVIISLWLPDSELWEKELGKLTQMCLGNGYPEEAIQHNIRMVMNRWKAGDYERKARGAEEKRWMSLLLRVGSEATANTM
ncbi:unnamed protein product [Protopolystoma xenopodis]|uniref:Uncharacterized protein n=1 Tax=Protopolystoma xenopodis TaxID=117903 RepID=A0A448XC14_9PLAT|nr:unnamed protein product [Protopolystoma xenopodis]